METLEPETLKQLPNFKARLEWFVQHRPDLRRNVAWMETQGTGARRLTRIFFKDGGDRRPGYGAAARFRTVPAWRDLILFYWFVLTVQPQPLT